MKMYRAWYMPQLESSNKDHAIKMVIVCLSMAIYWELIAEFPEANRRYDLLVENIYNAEQYAIDIM